MAAQRNSEYDRVKDDLYITPRWVYEKLYTVEPWAEKAFDCAPVNKPDYDFLKDLGPFFDGVCTNPPFKFADKFIKHSLGYCVKYAFLLPYTFDAAASRVDMFAWPFKARYNITRRIRWDNLEQKKNGPSTNHAWYVWDKSLSLFTKPVVGWL